LPGRHLLKTDWRGPGPEIAISKEHHWRGFCWKGGPGPGPSVKRISVRVAGETPAQIPGFVWFQITPGKEKGQGRGGMAGHPRLQPTRPKRRAGPVGDWLSNEIRFPGGPPAALFPPNPGVVVNGWFVKVPTAPGFHCPTQLRKLTDQFRAGGGKSF